LVAEASLESVADKGGLSTIRKGISDDLFFVCASFEQRTTSAAKCLAEDYRAKKAFVYYNEEFISNRETARNLQKLCTVLRPKCDVTDEVAGSLIDPKKQFMALRKAILSLDLDSVKAVTVDVTTFNREALLVLMALLRNNCKSARIRVLYVSPTKHGEWLSRGFREVRNIIGFPGIQRGSRSTMLVVLSGFEPDRIRKLIEEHEPKTVLLGFGDPPTERQFLDRNIEEQKTVLARQNVERFNFPANGIEKCHRILTELLSKYLFEYNIILAPMSTKLSTLGGYLTVEAMQEIQMTYCVPSQYNVKNYSKGESHLFMEEMPMRPKDALTKSRSDLDFPTRNTSCRSPK